MASSADELLGEIWNWPDEERWPILRRYSCRRGERGGQHAIWFDAVVAHDTGRE